MMKNVVTIFFTLFTIVAWAQTPSQSLTSKIEQVTVYFNGAQVTRSATALVASGRSELIFKDLSQTGLDLNTLQVRADSGACTVLSVTHRYNFLNQATKKDTIIQLEKQQEELTEFMTLQNNSLALISQEEQILQRNQVQIVGVANTTLKIDDLRQLIDYERGRLAELMTKRFELQKSTKKISDELNRVRQQIAELQNVQTERRLEIVVAVQMATAASVRFELKYQSTAAQWLPEYDLRVSDVSAPLSLLMRAKVRQFTGEDWKNVKLSLSTADPNQGGVKPELQPWLLRAIVPDISRQLQGQVSGLKVSGYVADYDVKATVSGTVLDEQGAPLIGASVLWKGTNKGASTDIDGRFTLPRVAGYPQLVVSFVGYGNTEVNTANQNEMTIRLKNGSNLNEVVVVSPAKKRGKREESATTEVRAVDLVERVQTTTTQFDIELPYTIASDNRFYNVDVKTLQIPTTYTYYVVPKLDKDAFLFAEITDWEQYNLLSGESNVFFENTFVGKTTLNTNELSDTLRISLGRDKNIGVERTKLRDFSKRNFLGDRKSDSRAYEIKIRNKKKTPINIVVEDQIPLTTDKSIEIESEAKNASIDATTGKVIWRINALKPSGEQKMQVQYTVRYPKEMNLNVN
jgi:ribosomal protein L29